MKKTKILSLLLSLSLFCSLIVPGTTAYAETGTAPGSGDNGMKISKTATANDDGTYTIKLEAFATGEKTTTTQTKDVPTDIVLVLDQSGSMKEDIGQVNYTQYTGRDTQNQNNYANRHNGGSANLWHKLNDGSYASVSVTKTTTYSALSSRVNSESSWGRPTQNCYWYYKENLYEKVGDEYKKVELDHEYVIFQGDRYTYTFADGTTVVSYGNGTVPNLDKHAPLYTPVADGNDTVYTYTYTDSTGAVQTIDTSTGASTSFTPAFYKRSTTSGGGTRIDALKTAAQTFANAVAAKAAGKDGNINTTDDNIDHRIAVVGYACGDWYSYTNYNYRNTEVFIGSNQYKYGTAAQGQYQNAFQSMTTSSGVNNVNASINALETDGGTLTNLGLEMANGIFEKNPINNGEQRNRVVILFTDGVPGWSGYESDVANSAITQASTAKNTYGATVYSIGIFAGADATSPGNQTGDETAKANWFMQNVSSNNGTPRTPSYYLSAGDADSLNSIFQQISDNITTGGSSTTLGSETVVKDIISPYFTLPAGASADNIKIDTYKCTGKNGNTYTWSTTSSGNGDATAKVDGDKVSVTGFNFSENWCGTETNAQGTTVRGKKLVISFKVTPKEGFLGGNGVPTNTDAGIYENSTAETPIMTFDKPTVNVPIKDVTVKAEDKNVYLKGEVTAAQLQEGAVVKVGNVNLDLSKANDTTKPYGLEKWQTEYVKIAAAVKDKDGNEISADSLKNLTGDKTYTVEVTVAPTTKGTSTDEKGPAATEQNNNANANINVFKPELTFKDSPAYYGENVPASNDYSGNKVSEKWMHNGTEAVPSEMLGSKPTLDIAYTPDESTLKDGKYTKQDVPVSATVKIGATDVNQYTAFEHQNCTPACGWETQTTPKGDPAFLIHVKTCTLSITKQGGANDESYVFDVYKDGKKYSEVTIWGNGTATLYELPVGTYTIKENEGWSWRYIAYNGSSAELTAEKPDGSITCTNTKNNHQWLNGFSTVVPNIFGTSHPSN